MRRYEQLVCGEAEGHAPVVPVEASHPERVVVATRVGDMAEVLVAATGGLDGEVRDGVAGGAAGAALVGGERLGRGQHAGEGDKEQRRAPRKGRRHSVNVAEQGQQGARTQVGAGAGRNTCEWDPKRMTRTPSRPAEPGHPQCSQMRGQAARGVQVDGAGGEVRAALKALPRRRGEGETGARLALCGA